ncbi:BrnA antitoxin family protein [Rhizobium sp. RAF56]|uniref:BrnA antitoxin family protein n=1 Tax=Rhizobium sp. RAF56 TaxID=3233062 RepID=UPI003F95B0CC
MSIKFSSRRPLTDEEEAKIQEMIASDPDNPELTDEQIAGLRPMREVLPDLAANIDREIAKRGRPKAELTKTPVTIRLDPDLVEHYKATGKGWQSRINDDLRKVSGL